MKEFDKWNSKQERIVPSDTGRLYTLIDHERKYAWRAALEMVQAWYKDAREGYDLGLWDMLKEELDGKT